MDLFSLTSMLPQTKIEVGNAVRQFVFLKNNDDHLLLIHVSTSIYLYTDHVPESFWI